MQEGLHKNWGKRMYRKGTLGGYTVVGFQYEDQTGETAWHITAWPNADPIHDYWVSEQRFYSMSIHFFYRGTNRTLIEVFDEIKALDPGEKLAVLKAIAEWEKPTEQNATTG